MDRCISERIKDQPISYVALNLLPHLLRPSSSPYLQLQLLLALSPTCPASSSSLSVSSSSPHACSSSSSRLLVKMTLVRSPSVVNFSNTCPHCLGQYLLLECYLCLAFYVSSLFHFFFLSCLVLLLLHRTMFGFFFFAFSSASSFFFFSEYQDLILFVHFLGVEY